MRHAADVDADAHTLRVAVADEAAALSAPPTPMDLPLVALVLRNPETEPLNVSFSVGRMVERNGAFTVTVPRTPPSQLNYQHSLVLGYVLDYELL